MRCSLAISGAEAGWDSGMLSVLMMGTIPLSHARHGEMGLIPVRRG